MSERMTNSAGHPAAQNTAREKATWLRSLPAVRERCDAVYALAEANCAPHFTLQPERLADVADFVLKVMHEGYPDGRIPNHSKLHDFDTGGVPRIRHLEAGWRNEDAVERVRRIVDLLTVSVLMDAGAGPIWQWRDIEYHRHGLSEGLALACLNLFTWGAFSTDPGNKHQVDGPGLAALPLVHFADALQVTAENPLPGLEGRWQVLQRLGALLLSDSPFFPSTTASVGAEPRKFARPGHMVDWLLARQAQARRVSVTDLWEVLQDGLGAVWPQASPGSQDAAGRVTLDSISLGDTWRHSALAGGAPGDELVPFHKLTQWLAHSLLEPLANAGLHLEDQHLLTGLAEFRNGALFIDLGVLTPRDPGLLEGIHHPGEEPIVEWRALTVALIDRLAVLLRSRLGRDERTLSISQVLQGGTWRAGRVLCRKLRPDGEPPIRLHIDGTVF